jgi:hypothetical protein
VNRSRVRRKLRDLLAARLGNVRCDYSPPVDGLEDLHVFFAGVTGEVDYPTSRAGTFQRDDDFDVTVWFRAHVPGDRDGGESDVAVEALFAHLEHVMADTPGPGLGVAGVQQAVLSEVNGPEPLRTEVGHESWIEARVAVSARLS